MINDVDFVSIYPYIKLNLLTYIKSCLIYLFSNIDDVWKFNWWWRFHGIDIIHSFHTRTPNYRLSWYECPLSTIMNDQSQIADRLWTRFNSLKSVDQVNFSLNWVQRIVISDGHNRYILIIELSLEIFNWHNDSE